MDVVKFSIDKMIIFRTMLMKIFSLVGVITMATCLLFGSTCKATDVWVDHWNSENLDIYVMDDTLTAGTPTTGKYFKIAVKEVQDGDLQRVVLWNFSKYKSDMWRYSTSTMKGNHTTVVNYRNRIFEFGMDRLGWGYWVKEGVWYY